MVKAIWVIGPTFGGTCTFREKVCWAACWGMGHGGATGFRTSVEDVSCMTVSSQELPFVPGLHTQSWGRRHIPPFWHGGAQLATKRHLKKYLWNRMTGNASPPHNWKKVLIVSINWSNINIAKLHKRVCKLEWLLLLFYIIHAQHLNSLIK